MLCLHIEPTKCIFLLFVAPFLLLISLLQFFTFSGSRHLPFAHWNNLKVKNYFHLLDSAVNFYHYVFSIRFALLFCFFFCCIFDVFTPQKKESRIYVYPVMYADRLSKMICNLLIEFNECERFCFLLLIFSVLLSIAWTTTIAFSLTQANDFDFISSNFQVFQLNSINEHNTKLILSSFCMRSNQRTQLQR